MNLILLLFFLSFPSFAFMPMTQMKVPVGSKVANELLTKEIFFEEISLIRRVYTPVASKVGKNILVIGNWESSHVNAYSRLVDENMIVTVFGGLARHPSMSRQSLRLVLCHEMGHFFGGLPKMVEPNDWASAEGQADYYASFVCMRKLAKYLSNGVEKNNIPEHLTSRCQNTFAHPFEKENCIATLIAGEQFTQMIANISDEAIVPNLYTREEFRASSTLLGYPTSQCRLDTFTNGSFCDTNSSVTTNPILDKSCKKPKHDFMQIKPDCWFRY